MRSADEIARHPDWSSHRSELPAALFRRAVGRRRTTRSWWRRLLEAQIAFVQPTSWQGEKVARLCFVNPRTTIDHVRAVLGTMA